MFDFQVREDAVVARDVIAEVTGKARSRPWMG
jgi:hypothetical protein